MKRKLLSIAAVLLLSTGVAQVDTNPDSNVKKGKAVTLNKTTTATGIQNNNLLNGHGGQPANTQTITGTQINLNGNNSGSINLNKTDDHHPGHEFCPAHDKTQAHFEEQGVWDQYQQSYNDGIQQSQLNSGGTKTPGTNTIAVIFHVVHEGEPLGTGTNVSNAAIMAVFNDLVEDFSLTNADQSLARTGLGFNPANTGINFCLATQDPMGVPLAETGVTRYQTTETWFDPDDPAEENAMKSAPLGSDIWDRDDYMNVWICDISNGAGSGTAGYAYVPSTSFLPNPALDGIVIDYNLGVNNDNVLTHEVGHYLGLYHTWGSGGCTVATDDGFTDTPHTQGPSFNYANSCDFGGGQQVCSGIETQFENYMDYSNCTVMFTTEQSNYMNTILNGVRSSLLLSPGCDPAGPPNCAFTSSPAGSPAIIPENGTVVFQDQSTGAPTAWTWGVSPGVQGTDWDFVGGTTANSQNPQITFYTAGNYDISLTASNGFGACTGLTEVGYVQVVLPAAGTDCDTLRNYALTENLAWYNNGGTWGYLGGHGEIFAGFPVDEWVEPHTATSTAEVRRLLVPFTLVEDQSGTGYVNFYVRQDSLGWPGAIQATETLLLADINDFAYNAIDFTTPASVTGQFWVGMQVFYGAPQDTTSVFCADLAGRPAGVGTTRMREGSNWYQTSDYYVAPGLNLSMAWDVLLSNGPAPVADLQFSEAAVCPGGDIVVNGSGSTNTTNYEWFVTDDPITTIFNNTTNAGETFNFPGPAGNYQIFLFADGSCMTDALVLPTTVYNAVTAGATVTHTTCGDNNGSVTITGASGGSGTYEYSLDGVNYQTGNTYNNLPAGNYTAYVRTTGDACETTIAFTINGSVPLSGTATPSTQGICPGGTASMTASGGTGYTWYDGPVVVGTTATLNISPGATTIYSVEITDGTCTDIQYANVTVHPLPTVDAGVDQTVCNGASVTLSGSGAASYTWDNGVTDGVAFTAASTTTYTVTGTDANGCQNTDMVTVTVNALPTVSAGPDQDVCTGNSVTLSGSGATSYTWDNGVTDGVAFSPVSTLTYTVTGTDGNGCQNTDQAVVTVNALPSVSAGIDQAVCAGGSVTLAGSGATSYSWDNGVTDGVAFTPASTTTYTVTGTDGNGCQNTDAVVVTVNALPTVNAGSDQTVCDGASVTLSGSGATSYSWDNGITDGIPFTATTTTTYTVTGTDGNGCQNTDQATVTVNANPTTSSLAETCNGTNTMYDISFDVTGGTGPYTIGGLAGSFAGSTWTSIQIASGTPYNLTITDANGCTATALSGVQNCACTTDAGTMNTGTTITVCGSGAATATHNADENFDGDDVMEFYLHDGSGTTLGTSFGTNTSPTFSFVGGMTYGTTYYISSVVGNNAGGGVVDLADPCLSIAAGTPVVWYDLPTVGAGTDQTVCSGDPVTLSGTGAISYTWDNGVSNAVPFNPTATLTYTVTGTDVNGCQNTDQVVVNVNALPAVSAGADQAICAGSSATLNGSGAVSYTWDNGVVDGVAFTPFVTNTYTVTGTDGNGCINTDQAVVTVNSLPTVSAGVDQSACAGDMVTLSGSGATTYTWDNGVTDGVAFAAATTTTYTVTGTDGNGCQDTDQMTLTVNALPTVDAGVDQTICDGGSVTLAGLGAVSYTWDNGVTDGVAFNPTATTTYTVTGTDVNGCQNTDAVTVTVNALPTVDAGVDQTVCQNDMVTLSGSGATTYTWDNGVTDGVAFAATVTTVYTVTGTDGNGCQNTDMVTVNVNGLPTVDAGMDSTICGSSDITFTGSGALTYVWDNGVTDGVPFTVTTTTTFTVTGTDANGCSNTDAVTITVGAGPTVTGVVTHDSGSSDGAIDVTITGGAPPYTISWDNGPTTEDQTGLAAGDYTITVTDTTGCEVQVTFTVLSTVGLYDNTLNEELTLYPNPTMGTFFVQLEGEYLMEITDARGRLIITRSENGTAEVDLSLYEAGMYFVRVHKDGETAIRKLMLK